MVHQNKWSGNKKNRLIEGEKMTHLSVEEILGYINAKKADAEVKDSAEEPTKKTTTRKPRAKKADAEAQA